MGTTGWLVPQRDVTVIAHAIVHLAGDDKVRAHLARNAHALIEREFEIKGNVSRLIDVFRQIVGRPRLNLTRQGMTR